MKLQGFLPSIGLLFPAILLALSGPVGAEEPAKTTALVFLIAGKTTGGDQGTHEFDTER